MTPPGETALPRVPTCTAMATPAGPEPSTRIAELERRIVKLEKINNALINRVERSTDYQGNSFSVFQTAILLERQVRDRTEELQRALRNLEDSNQGLSAAKEEADTARTRLTEAIESLSEGFALFDADDRLVLFNSKLRVIFPDLADIIVPGIEFANFLRRALERQVVIVPGGDAEAWLERRVVQHREPRDPVIHALSDGRWLQASERPTSSGATVCIYTDVTEIKKMEAQRRERELEEKSLQLTATLDNLSQGVSLFDREHKLAYWNTRFISLMGLPAQMVRKGADFQAVLSCGFVRNTFPGTDLYADLIEWSRSSERMKLFRADYRRHDDTVVEIRRNAMPDGGFLSTYTDVTDQRRAAKILEEAKETLERRVVERTAELTELNEELELARAAAEEANLSKTKFLAAASHDLLQPLNAAQLFVSALQDSEVPKDLRRHIERVGTALESVDGLLKALFDISKLDTGVTQPEWRDFSVDGLLKALANEFAFLAERKGLALRVVPCSVVIKSDTMLLRRILQNFVSNAIRYTGRGGVLFGCRRKKDSLLIEAWDTGPGIPEKHLKVIFEEFQRFQHPETGGDSGLGLGLAIAQRSAKVLGHPIHVSSTVGKGSKFSVEVPYGQIASAEMPGLAPASASVFGRGHATVVCIENDRDNLEGMTALLARWSCRVVPARTAGEAQALISAHRIDPDLIIADYHLDHGQVGLDAIMDLCEHCGLPIPGIIVTADHTAGVQEAIKSAGYELLQKPIKPAELRSLMSHLMA